MGMNMKKIIGSVPASDSKNKRRERIHQGWWRAFVLGLPAGEHPSRNGQPICNTLPKSQAGFNNFLTNEIGKLAEDRADKHQEDVNSSGIIEKNRLMTNLLSSQPLVFNFFGIFILHESVGLAFLQVLYPEVTKIKEVFFEFGAPSKNNYPNDNTAFDVAIAVETVDQCGLIGIECKYTDDFSHKIYREGKNYQLLYEKTNRFCAEYDDLVNNYNQLFRNQLLGECFVLDKRSDYQFIKTILFCSSYDQHAKTIGKQFQATTQSDFRIVDYFDYIRILQQKQIPDTIREYTMLLWARYCAHTLSESAFKLF